MMMLVGVNDQLVAVNALLLLLLLQLMQLVSSSLSLWLLLFLLLLLLLMLVAVVVDRRIENQCESSRLMVLISHHCETIPELS